jgi:MFS transporter, UMF1 family
MSTANVGASVAPRAERKIPFLAVTSWVLYDLANTIFSMAIVSLYFSLWIRDRVGTEQVDGVYGLTTAISMALIFIASPLLGALSDQARRRMPFLVISTLICVIFTALLGQGGLLVTLALFVVANVAYQAGLQFYDALLPEVSTEENRGWIGGIGVGVGYLGSYIGVGVGLVLLSVYNYPIEIIFPVVAVLFLLFALPCFFFVKERGNPRARPFTAESVRRATGQMFETLRNSQRYPGLLRFLIGRVFYTDAINTVVSIMGIYVVNQVVRSGLLVAQAEGKTGAALEQVRADLEAQGATSAQLILLGAITFAVLGGFVWGKVVDRIGPKRTLDIVLFMWIGIFLMLALIGLLGLPIWVFYIVAAITGIAMGGVWTADRPYMLRLTPPARVGEFYGLYGMVGRFSAITGPLIWALVVGAIFAGNPDIGQPIGVLLLMLFIVLSYVILRPVSDVKRQWSAEDRGEVES